MRNRFEHQLTTLNNELITMGAMCEEAISAAAEYLLEDDKEKKETAYEAVYDADRQIDRKERDIEALCMRLLLQQQPVAKDLRTVSSALKMISDMERIGDQASDIAEIAGYISSSELSSKTHIAKMAHATVKMVTESVESFVKKDIELAQSVIEHDDIVDGLFDEVKSELIEAIENGNNDAESLIDMVMIAKYFERIGDHAENIAEWVIYSITGTHNEDPAE